MCVLDRHYLYMYFIIHYSLFIYEKILNIFKEYIIINNM